MRHPGSRLCPCEVLTGRGGAAGNGGGEGGGGKMAAPRLVCAGGCEDHSEGEKAE